MVATVPQTVPKPAVRSRQGNRTFTLGTLSAATETRTITYDGTQGVRISRDPLADAEMLQGTNLYAYVGNDPIFRIDPTGEDWKSVAVAAIIWLHNLFNPTNQWPQPRPPKQEETQPATKCPTQGGSRGGAGSGSAPGGEGGGGGGGGGGPAGGPNPPAEGEEGGGGGVNKLLPIVE